MLPATPDAVRLEQIRSGLAAVRGRVVSACASAGRDPDEITLIVVTKTYPSSDVRALVGLGVRDVGENRDQDAAPKARECRDLDLRWHFIGQLQTNKCRSVVTYADLVHSVDRLSLVTALAKAAAAVDRRLDCLIQVSLDGAPGRGGALPKDLAGLARAVGEHPSLRLRGVMAVAPLGVPPLEAFAPLPDLLGEVRETCPDADVLSAGMSADLEAAVARGATHLRVGSAVLGSRPPLR